MWMSSAFASHTVLHVCTNQYNLPGPQIMCFKEACLLCPAGPHKVEGSGPLILPLQAKPYPAILQILFIKSVFRPINNSTEAF